MRNRPYSIVESQAFHTKAQELMGDPLQWDELKTNLDLFIARDIVPFVEMPNGRCVVAQGHLNITFSVDQEGERVTYEEIEWQS